MNTYSFNSQPYSIRKFTNKIDINTPINCKCAEPVIIINPHLRRNLIRLQYLHFPLFQSKITPQLKNNYISFHRYINSNKYRVDYENINEYYSVTNDGEIIPLFILVPCNKCFICNDKLNSMWQFRGIAESNTSINKTYFITLTFNNEHLPFKGVSVKDIQLFLKRLRTSLDELNIEHSIKYFACGEYGKNFHRPHYHLVLWHFPDNHPYFPNLTSILHFIEDKWSVYDYENKIYIPLGYAYCKVCDSGSLRYVMKYARKQEHTPPLKNNIFTCCSKGIGLQYFLDNYDFLKQNPQLLYLSIKDPVKNDVYTSPVPTYYKNKLAPTFCKFFPGEVVDGFEKYLLIHRKITSLCYHMDFNNYSIPDSLKTFYKIFYDDTLYYDVDDYYYHKYATFNQQQLFNLYEKLMYQLTLYNQLFTNLLNNVNLNEYNNSLDFQRIRKIFLDSRKFTPFTLNQLRIENEKLEIWKKNEIDRQYIE